MKFRKRPVIVEAYQTEERVEIVTLEGTMIASPGDWIITGVAGEKYPCKPDIFFATYEPVADWPPVMRDAEFYQVLENVKEYEVGYTDPGPIATARIDP